MKLLEFSSGSVYQYSDVDHETWASLQDTDHTGRFFNSEIKGQYFSEARRWLGLICSRHFSHTEGQVASIVINNTNS